MTNLEIVKSTYEGKNSEENGKALAAHAADNIQWTDRLQIHTRRLCG